MSSSIKTRESNMELLRIISMIFIIFFHLISNSNFQYEELNVNNLFIKSGVFFGELGVNLFILITGYYLCKSKPSFKKIVLLLFEVFFYNLLNYFIGYKVGYINSLKELSMIFPVITGKYWFITAYLLIYMLSPYYNKLIDIFKKRDYQKFLIINLIIWCIIPSIFGFFYNSSEELLFYNRFIWLSFMYFVGAYIRMFGVKMLNSFKKSLITFGISLSIMVFSIIIIDEFRDTFFRIGTIDSAYFWTPNNIFMFMLSISFFVFFTKLHIGNNIIINKISSTTLGIYLLHDGRIKKYMWKMWAKSDIYIYENEWFIYTIILVMFIFVLGMLIDMMRQFLEKYSVKKIIDLKLWSEMFIEFKKIGLIIVDKLL